MNEKSNTFPWSLERGTSRIFDPQSKTAILRWFAQEDIPRQQKEDFIQALIDFEDGCGGFYRYRAYFLAAEALAYFPDCDKGDEIVRQLLRWSYAYFQEFPNWEKFPLPLVRTAQAVLKRTDRKRVIAAFVEKVHTTESQFVLRHAAERLGKLDPGNKSAISQSRIIDAIAALVLLMQRSQEPYTIWKATHSLMAIDPENPFIIPTLVSLIQNLSSPFCLLQKAIGVLGEIGEGNEIAIDALIRSIEMASEQFCALMRGDSSYLQGYAEYAAENLGKIAAGNPKALATLVQLLTTMPAIAIAPLAKIAFGNESAIAALTEIVQNNPDFLLQCRAAVSLFQIDPGNTIAVTMLSQAIKEDMSPYLRGEIANLLIDMEDYREDAIAALQDILQNLTYDSEPFACLSSLARIDPTRELVLDTIFQLWRKPTICDYILSYTIEYLGNLLLEDDLNSQLTEYQRKGQCDPVGIRFAARAIAELTEFIQKLLSEDDFARLEYPLSVAAVTLGKLDPRNSVAVSTLMHLIEACDLSDPCQGLAYYTLTRYCRNLAEIGAIDRIPINKIVECFLTVRNEDNNEQFLLKIAQMLTQGQLKMPKHSLLQLVRSLKPYLGESCYRNPSHCYDTSYQIIWHCSQHLSYPEFDRAWQE